MGLELQGHGASSAKDLVEDESQNVTHIGEGAVLCAGRNQWATPQLGSVLRQTALMGNTLKSPKYFLTPLVERSTGVQGAPLSLWKVHITSQCGHTKA